METINIIFIAVVIMLALPMLVIIGINLYYRYYQNSSLQILNCNEEEKV